MDIVAIYNQIRIRVAENPLIDHFGPNVIEEQSSFTRNDVIRLRFFTERFACACQYNATCIWDAFSSQFVDQ